MDTKFFIPVLLGSKREGRISDKAANYVVSLLQKRGVDSQMIDPRTLHTLATTEKMHPEPWHKTMDRADALIIVTPEYNHGYPGALKEILDSCYDEYEHKPVAICGTSAGGMGGCRVVEQLRQVVIELHMVAMREAVYFSNHTQLWNDDGTIKDPAYEARVNFMLDELLWYTQILKEGKEKMPFPEKK